jgi:hypothetical protein
MLLANTRRATLAPAPSRSNTSPGATSGSEGTGMPAGTCPITGTWSFQPTTATKAVADATASKMPGTPGAQRMMAITTSTVAVPMSRARRFVDGRATTNSPSLRHHCSAGVDIAKILPSWLEPITTAEPVR